MTGSCGDPIGCGHAKKKQVDKVLSHYTESHPIVVTAAKS
jgi:hypothetical protein